MNEKCQHCGAKREKSIPDRYDCGTRVDDWPSALIDRTDACYENEIIDLRKTLQIVLNACEIHSKGAAGLKSEIKELREQYQATLQSLLDANTRQQNQLRAEVKRLRDLLEARMYD